MGKVTAWQQLAVHSYTILHPFKRRYPRPWGRSRVRPLTSFGIRCQTDGHGTRRNFKKIRTPRAYTASSIDLPGLHRPPRPHAPPSPQRPAKRSRPRSCPAAQPRRASDREGRGVGAKEAPTRRPTPSEPPNRSVGISVKPCPATSAERGNFRGTGRFTENPPPGPHQAAELSGTHSIARRLGSPCQTVASAQVVQPRTLSTTQARILRNPSHG